MSCFVIDCELAASRLCIPHMNRLAWTCYGKWRFERGAAFRSSRNRTGETNAYLCPVCSCWHVGHIRPETQERWAEANFIVRSIRIAGQGWLLGRLAEEWNPRNGADRSGAWITRVRA